jgi:hypothetical protein
LSKRRLSEKAAVFLLKYTAMSPQTRQQLLNIARIVISAGLLIWIVSSAGLDNLWDVVRGSDAALYGLALLLPLAGMFGRAMRWRALLYAINVRLPFGRLVYLYFIGAFFNTFLPTGFGGDVIRALEVGPSASSQQATGTIVVDRLAGFVALFIMALIALPWAVTWLPMAWVGLVALAGVGVILGTGLLLEGRLLRAITARLPRRLSLAGDAWIGQTYQVMTACRAGLPAALGWSVAFNIGQITASYLAARALQLDLPYSVFFVVMPITAAVLLVPISISGLGVREGVYVTLFGALGVTQPQAVALSLAVYGLDFAMGIVGGLVYLANSLKAVGGQQ